VPDDDIREAIRRIGRVVREQVGLFGTLTGSPLPRESEAAEHGEAEQGGGGTEAEGGVGMADVLPLPRREEDGRRQRRGR
jgi:2-aminoadipate transaminase